jgi:hypothetical protein
VQGVIKVQVVAQGGHRSLTFGSSRKLGSLVFSGASPHTSTTSLISDPSSKNKRVS